MEGRVWPLPTSLQPQSTSRWRKQSTWLAIDDFLIGRHASVDHIDKPAGSLSVSDFDDGYWLEESCRQVPKGNAEKERRVATQTQGEAFWVALLTTTQPLV